MIDEIEARLNEAGLDWTDVDRIELQQDDYDKVRDRANRGFSNWSTSDKPALRVTNSSSRIVYVNDEGVSDIIEL